MSEAEKTRNESSRFDREFLRGALALAAKAEVDHFLYICDVPIAAEDLRRRKIRHKLVYAVTAEPIARACGLHAVIDDGLREIAYGAWEGRLESEIKQSDPDAYDAWRNDPSLVAPPGGESAFAIAARALPAILRARREHPQGRVMLVSHKATVRVIVAALLGMPLGRFRSHVACPTASITSFEFGERGPMLVRVGDVHHLA